jgi:hypothetical protein
MENYMSQKLLILLTLGYDLVTIASAGKDQPAQIGPHFDPFGLRLTQDSKSAPNREERSALKELSSLGSGGYADSPERERVSTAWTKRSTWSDKPDLIC